MEQLTPKPHETDDDIEQQARIRTPEEMRALREQLGIKIVEKVVTKPVEQHEPVQREVELPKFVPEPENEQTRFFTPEELEEMRAQAAQDRLKSRLG